MLLYSQSVHALVACGEINFKTRLKVLFQQAFDGNIGK